MARTVNIVLILIILLGVAGIAVLNIPKEQPVIWMNNTQAKTALDTTPTPIVSVKEPQKAVTLAQKTYVAQSFNNCGPASLSMLLSYFDKHFNQAEIASELRPFNNPAGGIDDKSVFGPELIGFAEKQGLRGIQRPAGDLTLLKTFLANDMPVMVRTWLNSYEDIGHYRVVRGYDDQRQAFLVDDSYNGPNLWIPYDEFSALWKPFNYGYIVLFEPEREELVTAIVGKNIDERVAYQNALEKAQEALRENPDDAYVRFNESVAYYYLGEYQNAVTSYESARSGLPGRMLWYQWEPIMAYQKIGSYDKVFELTDSILLNGNLAYSELYQIRGEVFLVQGNLEAARAEFEKAVYYNSNYKPAKDSLKSLFQG